jgi:hypothetical protein
MEHLEKKISKVLLLNYYYKLLPKEEMSSGFPKPLAKSTTP